MCRTQRDRLSFRWKYASCSHEIVYILWDRTSLAQMNENGGVECPIRPEDCNERPLVVVMSVDLSMDEHYNNDLLTKLGHQCLRFHLENFRGTQRNSKCGLT
jgi:hypothetical protein